MKAIDVEIGVMQRLAHRHGKVLLDRHDHSRTTLPQQGHKVRTRARTAARILALLTLRDAQVQLDAEAVTRSLEDLTRQVDVVRSLKTKLTHIGSTAREVADALDLLRAGVLRSVKDLESQLAVVEADAGTSLTA